MHVFVVGWHPAPGHGANGGFEWRYNRTEALRALASLVVLEADNQGPRHNIVFVELDVPFEVDYNRPRTFSDLEPQITRWIDENLHLIELPEPPPQPKHLHIRSAYSSCPICGESGVYNAS